MFDNDHFPNEDQCGFYDSDHTWWEIRELGIDDPSRCEEEGCDKGALFEALSVGEESNALRILCCAHMEAWSRLTLSDDLPIPDQIRSVRGI
jgi:hypothetical protein